jgi:protein-disulfide isomerase-like protein with CxxC motif
MRGGVISDYLGSWCYGFSSCIGSASNWLLSCGGLIWEGISLAKDNGCPSSS